MATPPTDDRVDYKAGFQGGKLFDLLQKPPTIYLRHQVAEIIAAGIDVNKRGDYGETYLHLLPACVMIGMDEGVASSVDYVLPVVYQLVTTGIDVTVTDNDGNTPLHICSVTGAGYRLARALVRVGVDPLKRNCRGETAASLAEELAVRAATPTAAAALKGFTAVLDEAGAGLWAAVMNGDIETVTWLVDCWYNVDLCRDGQTLVSAARQKMVADETSGSRSSSSASVRSSSSASSSSTAMTWILQHIDKKAPTVRMALAALAGDSDAVLEILLRNAKRPEIPAPDANACDPGGYRAYDEKTNAIKVIEGGRPLLAEVVHLRHFNVARVLAETGNADVNVVIWSPITGLGRRSLPLFQMAANHALDETDVKRPHWALEPLIAKADFSLIVDPASFVSGLCRRLERRRKQLGNKETDVLELFTKQSFSLLSASNADGLRARELLFLDCLATAGAKLQDLVATSPGGPEKLQKGLVNAWRSWVSPIDSLVIEAVRREDIEKLEQLANDGYEYINVVESVSDDSDTTRSALELARDGNLTKSIEFLESLSKRQFRARQLHRAISKGNLIDTRRYLDQWTVKTRDRAGRQALHSAVLFERRYIIRELLQNHSGMVNATDSQQRTALHYAYCVESGEDIINALSSAGADASIKDEDDNVPSAYASDPGQSLITRERARHLLNDIFYVERHLEVSEAIQAADVDKSGGGKSRRLERVRELCETLLDSDEMNLMASKCELLANVVRRGLIDERPLLAQCVDCDAEDVACYLIERGVSTDCSVKVGAENKSMSLLEAANAKGMRKLASCLQGEDKRCAAKRNLAPVAGCRLHESGCQQIRVAVAYTSPSSRQGTSPGTLTGEFPSVTISVSE